MGKPFTGGGTSRKVFYMEIYDFVMYWIDINSWWCHIMSQIWLTISSGNGLLLDSPNLYRNQCSQVLWHSPVGNFSGNVQAIHPCCWSGSLYHQFISRHDTNHECAWRRPEWNGPQFADNIMKLIFLKEVCYILIYISLWNILIILYVLYNYSTQNDTGSQNPSSKIQAIRSHSVVCVSP